MDERPDPDEFLEAYFEREVFPIFDAAVAHGLTREEAVDLAVAAIDTAPPFQVREHVIEAFAEVIERRDRHGHGD